MNEHPGTATPAASNPASSPRSRNRRFFRRFLALLCWLLLCGAGAVAWDAHVFLSTPGNQGAEPPLARAKTLYDALLAGVPPWDVPSPVSSEPREVVISIEPGAVFDRVAWDLKKAGVITNVYRFRLLGKLEKSIGRVRAGEFAVNTGWTPEQVLEQITRGQPLLHRLALREGLTWWQTARAVEEQGFARYEDFVAVIHDPEFLRRHHIPFATAEGFLYPETYLLRKPGQLDRAAAEGVADLLVSTFWRKNTQVWRALPQTPRANAPTGPQPAAASPGAQEHDVASSARNTTERQPETSAPCALPPGNNGAAAAGSRPAALPAAAPSPAPASPAEVDPEALKRTLILASLVEKETGLPEERARVAGVYANRLRLGMLLQCDPTIIYGVGPSFSGAIRRSQLDDPTNPYNTYQHPGLPPGPICSPGAASLEAALHPEKHDFLYFVATGTDKSHVFSRTLTEHNRAVQQYRRTQRR